MINRTYKSINFNINIAILTYKKLSKKGEISMRFVDIIHKKRYKEELTNEEIQFFIDGVVDGSIPDYQVSALLMAIVLNIITV